MLKLKSIRSLILGLAMVAAPAASQAGIFISVRFGPPVLPVYVQPVCPGDGYIWTPGYWAYSDLSGYYWVPGTWVPAPQPGYLWTPPYWGFAGGVYGFHPGYWGPHVGFYGGVNYGFGYTGVGFAGGIWAGGVFRYNTAYANVGGGIHNVYNRTVIINNVTHVSYNGGPGGVNARPSNEEMLAERDHHIEATQAQAQHEHAAVANRQQWASQNHGNPAFAASARPGEFSHAAPTGHPAAAANHVTPPAAHPQAQAVHSQAPSQPHVQPQAQTAHTQAQAPAHAQPQAQVHTQPQAQAHAEAKSGKSEGQKGGHPTEHEKK